MTGPSVAETNQSQYQETQAASRRQEVSKLIQGVPGIEALTNRIRSPRDGIHFPRIRTGAKATAILVVAGIIASSISLGPRQAIAQESSQRPTGEGIVSVEQREITDYSMEDLRSAGENHLVGLVTFRDGKHIVSEDWDAAGNLQLKDRGRLSFFPLTAIQSETNPSLRAAVGKRGQMEDVGVLWLPDSANPFGKTYGHDGGTIIDAQFDPENKSIITVEADPANENQVLYFNFDLATKTFSRLNFAAGDYTQIQTPLRATNTPGISEAYGVSPVKRGYMKIAVDTINKTISTQWLNIQEGYGDGGRLVQFTDPQGRDRVWLFNIDTTFPDGRNGIDGTLYDNINGVPVAIQAKEFSDLGSAMVVINAAAPDVVSGIGYMGEDNVDFHNIGTRFIETFDLNDQLNLTKRSRFKLPGQSQGGAFSSVQVLNHGQDRYLAVGLKNSVTPADNGLWVKKINSESSLVKVPIIPLTQIYLPVTTKANSTGW